MRVDRDMGGEAAARAAEVLGLEYAGGVDFLIGGDGLMINEVNAVPEFKGLMQSTGVDVPGLLADYLIEAAKRGGLINGCQVDRGFADG